MNLNFPIQKQRGFTMVEIALSIAVVAFALVALMGVLPTGLTVQKENREDTIINQEGRFWLEAIRSGARGLDQITNYVEELKIIVAGVTNVYENTPATPLTAEQIIGVLSAPLPPYPSFTNNESRVVARVKALTGSAVDAGGLTNETSFRYEMHVYFTPHFIVPTATIIATADQNAWAGVNLQHQRDMIAANLHDLRLELKWPLFERGNGWVAGNEQKTFRAQVAGRTVIATNLIGSVEIEEPVRFARPNQYEFVPRPGL